MTRRASEPDNPWVPAKVIKRYANRKLYDTERSCYVTLDEVGGMLSRGQEVRVVDNRSGEDLTRVTLAQILVGEEKGRKARPPLPALRDLLQSGGDFLRDRVATPVQDLLSRAAEPGSASPPAGHEGPGPVAALLERSHEALDDLQRRIDERLHKLVGPVAHVPALQADIEALRRRVEDLEARLATVEAKAPTG